MLTPAVPFLLVFNQSATEGRVNHHTITATQVQAKNTSDATRHTATQALDGFGIAKKSTRRARYRVRKVLPNSVSGIPGMAILALRSPLDAAHGKIWSRYRRKPGFGAILYSAVGRLHRELIFG